jgi:hypothetical protein
MGAITERSALRFAEEAASKETLWRVMTKKISKRSAVNGIDSTREQYVSFV